jgi:hypothetical protein
MSVLPFRPGSRVVTSWSSQPLPSGSLNDAYAKYERPGKSGNPGGFGCSSTSLTSTPRLTRSSGGDEVPDRQVHPLKGPGQALRVGRRHLHQPGVVAGEGSLRTAVGGME